VLGITGRRQRVLWQNASNRFKPSEKAVIDTVRLNHRSETQADLEELS
jgi:hypothetical protein